jgi:hypothetical protein
MVIDRLAEYRPNVPSHMLYCSISLTSPEGICTLISASAEPRQWLEHVWYRGREESSSSSD